MNSNEKMWNSIEILMKKSFWGRNSSIDSLTRNLREEVQEFIWACQNNDSANAREEASDVMMILLCMLYRTIDDEDYSSDEIADRITEKLHWRYGHLYIDSEGWDSKAELEKWSDAKEIEHKINLMFCENLNCPNFGKIDGDNILYKDKKYWCKICKEEIIPSKNNALLYRDKKASHYMQEIIKSVLAYSEGNKNAALELSIDSPKAFKALCVQLLDTENDKSSILPIFIRYIWQKYRINTSDIKSYIECVKEVRKQMKTESLLEKYYKQIILGNYHARNSFTIIEWQKIIKDIKRLTFDIEKVIKKSIYFSARHWDNQVVHKYLLYYPDRNSKKVIECMTLIHYKREKVRDLTIELSNMYNCVAGCQFCASGALPGEVEYLEAMDYVKQLNTCLQQSGIDPSDFENFYVSFAGIGEPSILYKNIAAGMVIMYDMYPQIQFNIATLGYQKECFDYWKGISLPIRTFQLPLYHLEKTKLKKIVQGIPVNYNLSYIIEKAVSYQNKYPACRIKINYIPMKGINDSDTDVNQFIHVLEPFKEKISVKISFLNYTKPAEKNGFITSGKERLEEIKDRFVEHGFEAYVFGSEKNTALGCGQLAQDAISGQV